MYLDAQKKIPDNLSSGSHASQTRKEFDGIQHKGSFSVRNPGAILGFCSPSSRFKHLRNLFKYCTSAKLSFFLCSKQANFTPTSGPLHLLLLRSV